MATRMTQADRLHATIVYLDANQIRTLQMVAEALLGRSDPDTAVRVMHARARAEFTEKKRMAAKQ